MTKTMIPPGPSGADIRNIKVDDSFRKAALRVVWAILLFILTYFLLTLFVLGIALCCVVVGLAAVFYIHQFIVIALAFGLAGMGVMLVIFMFKFIFKRKVVDTSQLIELRPDEEPRLFEFIHQVASEAGTPIPKKVYLSPDVNACVFYNSSFWSMFFPIRKNLQIGLGLVNAVTVSEFKAILAHEFGHFSQSSMRLGSYVYSVNQVIHNLLYDNDDYNKLLTRFAGFSSYTQPFARASVFFIESIQQALHKVYEFLQRHYMGLSREMEFYADAVAAHAAGSENLVNSLRRIEAAQLCYDTTLEQCNVLLQDNRKTENVYPNHSDLMAIFAEEHHIPQHQGYMQVSAHSLEAFRTTNITVKDQWASHPDIEDREAYVNRFDMHAPVIYESPWQLFTDPESTQRRMTGVLYQAASAAEAAQVIDRSEFTSVFRKRTQEYQFDPVYKGYYDRHTPVRFDTETLANQSDERPVLAGLDMLFSDKTGNWSQELSRLENDIRILEVIASENSKVETFDYKGQRYTRDDAYKLMLDLKDDLEDQHKMLVEHDRQIFLFFLKTSTDAGRRLQLRERYDQLFTAQDEWQDHVRLLDTLSRAFQPVFEENLPVERAREVIQDARNIEKEIKPRYNRLFEQHKTELKGEALNQALDYFSRELTYMSANQYDNVELQLLQVNMQLFAQLSEKAVFLAKKQLLDFQVSLVNTVAKG